MSSFNANEDSITTFVKIELEKISAGSPTSTADSADGDSNSNSINIPVKNISGRNTQGSGVAAEGVYNNTSESTHGVEVPITGIRYFKNICNADALKNSCEIGDQLADISSAPVAHNEVAKAAGDLIESSSSVTKPLTYKDIKYGKVEIYEEDTGPRIYNVKGSIVSRPIITKNLPEVFRALPIYGKPDSEADSKEFYENKIRDYIGYGLSDSEFRGLNEYMNGDYLRTGLECETPYRVPSQGPLPGELNSSPVENGPGQNLCIVKKLQLRIKKDKKNHYPRKLKYRGLRMLPLSLVDENEIATTKPTASGAEVDDGPVVPGKDLIFRVRMYRPYSYGSKDPKELKPTRHSVYNNDLVMLGRQRLTELRDRITCANDIGMRIEVSADPDFTTTESAKKLFPSGFLFINNVFYVDSREGCRDHTVVLRQWARSRGLGVFPARDMGATRLQDIVLRLGHPEVYMHQGNCEHLFTFSEVWVAGGAGPARADLFPRYTQIAQNQSVYCTTCAEFGAKWLVLGCVRVPFDPAFFCDTCYRLYMYDREGNKIGNFKAYSYKGNMVNFLRPVAGVPSAAAVAAAHEATMQEDSN